MTAKPRKPLRSRFSSAAQCTMQIVTDSGDWGSGIVIAETGVVLTSYHVVRGATKIVAKKCRVRRKDGWRLEPGKREYEAVIISVDRGLDIAVLKLQTLPISLSVARLGNSAKLMTGTALYRVGNDKSVPHFSDGWLFDFNVVNRTKRFQVSMHTDGGGSGGPLIDSRGRVVGILIRGQHETATHADYAEAVPINAIKRRMLRRQEVRAAMHPPSDQTLDSNK